MFLVTGVAAARADGEPVPVGVVVLASAWLSYVIFFCLRLWFTYGRLPMSERGKHRERFKAAVFLRYPVLYLIQAAICFGGILALWWAVFS